MSNNFGHEYFGLVGVLGMTMLVMGNGLIKSTSQTDMLFCINGILMCMVTLVDLLDKTRWFR